MPIARPLLAAALFALALGTAPIAAGQTAEDGVGSSREKACNRAATDHQLTGDIRRTFLADCVKGKSTDLPASGTETCAARGKKADQQKLKGEERRLFMSGCLKRP